jgi:hypothetical protein
MIMAAHIVVRETTKELHPVRARNGLEIAIQRALATDEYHTVVLNIFISPDKDIDALVWNMPADEEHYLLVAIGLFYFSDAR